MNTPGENDNKRRLYEGNHLKRVSIQIQFKNHPEIVVVGYALSHEILPKQVSFFAAQKFPIDEELIISYFVEGEKKTLNVKLSHMHEQISSGRVMNGLPDEAHPFPALKFYRCYTRVLDTGALTGETPKETETETEAEAKTAEAAPVAESAPAPESAPVVEEPKAA